MSVSVEPMIVEQPNFDSSNVIDENHELNGLDEQSLAPQSMPNGLAREEYIPGISKGKKKLHSVDVDAHLGLADEMHKGGLEHNKKEEYSFAAVRFSQGIELLKNVEGFTASDTFRLEEKLLVFYKNFSQMSLKINNWTDCLQAAEQALKLTAGRDSKALFRQGEALQLLGRITEAKLCFTELLRLSRLSEEEDAAEVDSIKQEQKKERGNSDYMPLVQTMNSEQRAETEKAALVGLSRCRLVSDNEKARMKKVMNNLGGTFAEDRAPATATLKNNNNKNGESEEETDEDRFLEQLRQQSLQSPSTKTTTTKKLTPHTPVSPKDDYMPTMDLEEVKKLMDALEETYSSDGFQFVMGQQRFLADFDEKRILMRARSRLPELCRKVMEDFGYDTSSENLLESWKSLDADVSFWRRRSPDLQKQSGRLLKLILGDSEGLE